MSTVLFSIDGLDKLIKNSNIDQAYVLDDASWTDLDAAVQSAKESATVYALESEVNMAVFLTEALEQDEVSINWSRISTGIRNFNPDDTVFIWGYTLDHILNDDILSIIQNFKFEGLEWGASYDYFTQNLPTQDPLNHFFTVMRLVWRDPEQEKIDEANSALMMAEQNDLANMLSIIQHAEEEDMEEDVKEEEVPVSPDYFLPTTHEVDCIYNRVYNNSQKVLGLKKQKAILELRLKRARLNLDKLNTQAILNWDKDTKRPVYADAPYNDGTNDDKRLAISRNLFKVEWVTVEQLQDLIDDLAIEILDPQTCLDLAEAEARNIEMQITIAKEARLAGIKFA